MEANNIKYIRIGQFVIDEGYFVIDLGSCISLILTTKSKNFIGISHIFIARDEEEKITDFISEFKSKIYPDTIEKCFLFGGSDMENSFYKVGKDNVKIIRSIIKDTPFFEDLHGDRSRRIYVDTKIRKITATRNFVTVLDMNY
jgi:chemotaxis receptor (MCP) glutamine deamidase CheD